MGSKTTQNFAPPLKRFLAWIIDLIIVALLIYSIRYLCTSAISLLHFALSGGKIYTITMILGVLSATLYHAIFESSRFQSTPGKLCFGLKVTDISGERITFVRALLRHLGKYLSELTLGIGYFLCMISKKKQCLHDVIAKCIVIEGKQTT